MRALRFLMLAVLIAIGQLANVSAQEKTPAPDRAGTIATAAVTGLASGVIGSLFAPWVQWSIELRRNRLGYRRDVIKFAREDARPGFSSADFLHSYSFSILQGEFVPEMIARLQQTSPPSGTTQTAWQEAIRLALLAEIARIERRWGLV